MYQHSKRLSNGEQIIDCTLSEAMLWNKMLQLFLILCLYKIQELMHIWKDIVETFQEIQLYTGFWVTFYFTF